MFLFFVAFLFSCSVFDEFKSKEFIYYEDGKKEHLALKIPKHWSEEKILLDSSGGKEQYYYYNSGALIYFSKDVKSWTTENQTRVDSVKKYSPKKNLNKNIYSGTDSGKLYWKEIQLDSFRFGYSYVPGGELEKFETAINSIRLKN